MLHLTSARLAILPPAAAPGASRELQARRRRLLLVLLAGVALGAVGRLVAVRLDLGRRTSGRFGRRGWRERHFGQEDRRRGRREVVGDLHLGGTLKELNFAI